ncbi:lytic transglycosylase domain-containing protein [Novosphingobium capsulatum]|uniref:lytic transglycosylase domain-containing protein n=1 Tax=Novosphingobium capsulatum TaxID=13688 RepID=UPI002E123F52|nr:lytic transglycosylase domain-containing protein [Novosphingobium capsulatum]
MTAASTLAGWRRSGEGAPVRYTVLLIAGLLASAIPVAAVAQPQSAERAATSDPYAAHIAEASQRFGVPVAWIRAVLHAESAGDPRAISSAGAMGLMQIMPATWAELRVRHRLGGDVYDPRDNILAGTAYLRELHDRYGNVTAMLAAYNAGPGRYEASLSGRPLPAETRAYVSAIAPIIDGGVIVTPVAVAVADPLAWTRAPLFIAQPDRHSAANLVQVERTSNDMPATVTVRDVSAIEPQSGGLFVARASTGPQP